MEFHSQEKNNGSETTVPAVQTKVDSCEKHDSQNKEHESTSIKKSESGEACPNEGAPGSPSTVGGATERKPESGEASPNNERAMVVWTANMQQPTPSTAGSSRKRKRTTVGNDELILRLFEFINRGEEYLLEMHEPATGVIDRYRVLVSEEDNKWIVKVYDLRPGEHVVFPLLEDTNSPMFPKTIDIPLQERLVGWTVEKRKRENGKEDKFYYHRGKQFRSLVEMASFVVYSSKPKDLIIPTSVTETSQNLGETEAIEAMMKISSSKPFNKDSSSTDLATEKETSNPSPLHDNLGQEPTNIQSNVAQAWQKNETSTVGVEEGNETAKDELMMLEGSKDGEHNKVVSAGASEGDNTGANEFIDYFNDIFEDEAPQNMNEILGEPKQTNS